MIIRCFRRIARQAMADKGESLLLRKISDLVERVNYLEEQNLSSRKALDTALLQNKHLERCIEHLGMTKYTIYCIFLTYMSFYLRKKSRDDGLI